MAGPLKATKEQVRQMLKDIEAAFYRERKVKRDAALEAEAADAKKYFDEMQRRAAQYGYTIEGGVTFTQGDGWIRGRAPTFRIK